MPLKPNDLHVTNTLTKKREKFVPVQPERVGIYVCGPTVYSDAHLGHAKSYVSFDVIVRYLRHLGYQVKYVQNITDVGHLVDNAEEGEDKIERIARIDRVHPLEIAEAVTRGYFKDMEGLGIRHANLYPRATQHIPEQIELTERLIAKGHAYDADGNVYFSVALVAATTASSRGARARTRWRGRASPSGRTSGTRATSRSGSAPRAATSSAGGARGAHGYPGLARRVLRDVDEVPRRGVRHPRRRAREPVPAPRMRDRPEPRGDGQALRPLLAAQQHDRARRPEDEQVARQRHPRQGPPEARRRADGARVPARRALPLDRRTTPTTASRARARASTACTRPWKIASERAKAADAGPGSSDATLRAARETCDRAFHTAMDDDFNTPVALAAVSELAKQINGLAADSAGAFRPPSGRRRRSSSSELAGDVLGILPEGEARAAAPAISTTSCTSSSTCAGSCAIASSSTSATSSATGSPGSGSR